MTNGIAIAIIALFMAIDVGLLLKLFLVDLRKSRDKLLLYMIGSCLALLGWEIDYMIYFLSSDADVIRLTYDLKLPFIAFMSFFMILLVVRFYRLEHNVNKTFIMIMLIVPCMTIVYSLMTANLDMIRENFSIIQVAPIHEVDMTRGVWFWAHTFSCYSFMLGAVIISLYCHNKLPQTYRTPSRAVLLGVIAAALINVLQVTGIGYQNFDITVIGANITVFTAYFAVTKSKGVDFITGARDEIYDYLGEGIAVLNDERYVVYINKSAGNGIKDLGLKVNVINESYDKVFESAVGIALNIEAAPADEDGLDMTFMVGDNEHIFNLSEKPIKDNSGIPIGTFVVIDEVTENRATINKLENIGGIDALTGLPNRRSIEKFMSSADIPEKLPIAVISGDINGLKQVNDSLGHKQGDVLIRVVSEIMADVCPTRGRVSRVGGDEFLIIVPNSDEGEIKNIIEEMEKLMNDRKDYHFRISVSLGYEFKTASSRDFAEVISIADEKMYEVKRRRREA